VRIDYAPFMGGANGYVSSCVGFRTPAITRLSTRSFGRRPKSAKARNRGCRTLAVARAAGAAGAMGIWARGFAGFSRRAPMTVLACRTIGVRFMFKE
jgi:hypothetical protein